MNKKKSIRVFILIPVLLLGVLSIASNILAQINLGKVGDVATKISDEYFVAITQLDNIAQRSKDIHTLALSHIVATDFDTMTEVITKIDEQEAALDENFAAYKALMGETGGTNLENISADYENYKDSVKVLLALSANQKTKEAYAVANGEVSESAAKLDADITEIITAMENDAANQRSALSTARTAAGVGGMIVIALSVIAILIAVYVVSRRVIKPVIKAESELNEIIDGINRREGDLTRRIPVESNDEIGALSQGINSFIEHLQGIFTMITNNSSAMDKVVDDVMGSVQTSNNSAADLSALTEELSATMQEVANSAGIINSNTETVRQEVDEMAQKRDRKSVV